MKKFFAIVVLVAALVAGPFTSVAGATTYEIYSVSKGQVIHSIVVKDGSDAVVVILVP